MKDLSIALDDRPGALAAMGDALGRAGVSVEGGGAWVVNGQGAAHFLFEDGAAARSALEAAGIQVVEERDVLIQRLKQDEPGQLGKLTRLMANAGVNIEALYSDHNHQLILVVDDMEKGRAVSDAWAREQAEGIKMKQHNYKVEVEWTGNTGEGTKTYRGYLRDHTITVEGKPQIPGSSDPSFRGDPSRYNPEDLLVASLSACHMLSYLHLCAVNHITVVDYRDSALGLMEENSDGSAQFTRVTLQPTVMILPGDDQAKAHALHAEAHHLCFIARSVNFAVDCTPTITEAATVAPSP